MKYFIIAGEASGDMHAAALMQAIKALDNDAVFAFLGGDLMAAQGGTMHKHYRAMAFMGFWEVAKNIDKVFDNYKACCKAIEQFVPDVVILIDYPSFNLRIAKFVKQHFSCPVHYYISPKIWAWKEYRIKDIKKYIDRMFCIFPFELEFYAKHNFKVDYVGNPTSEKLLHYRNDKSKVVDFLSENACDSRPLIAVLAGSRKQEIRKCLPTMLAAAAQFTTYQIVVAGAPGIDAAFYKPLMVGVDSKIIFDKTHEIVQAADIAIVNSGTATLETAIIGTPQVVVYHVMFGRLAYWLKSIVIKTKHISLVNIIAQKAVVKELIAHLFTVENIVDEINKIRNNKNYNAEMKAGYDAIVEALGTKQAATETASLIYKALKNK